MQEINGDCFKFILLKFGTQALLLKAQQLHLYTLYVVLGKGKNKLQQNDIQISNKKLVHEIPKMLLIKCWENCKSSIET